MGGREEWSGRDIGAPERSAQACPVCGAHELAIDEPPRIDILGVQPYSDLLGMGDPSAGGRPGIVCRQCGTYWRDREAFDRGEPEPPLDETEQELVEGGSSGEA